MPSYNRLILLGHLTRDPALSYLPSQTQVVEFGIATNRKWSGQDGGKQEEVCFVDCVMFGKRAEVIQKYSLKGDLLHVEGKLKLDTWKDADGNNRSKHWVKIDNFEFMSTGEPKPKEQAKPKAEDDSDSIPF